MQRITAGCFVFCTNLYVASFVVTAHKGKVFVRSGIIRIANPLFTLIIHGCLRIHGRIGIYLIRNARFRVKVEIVFLTFFDNVPGNWLIFL